MNWMVIKRMLVAGGKNFARGGAVSAATVLIMTVTLAIIASLIFLSALLSFTLATISEKVDVSVYFVTTAREADRSCRRWRVLLTLPPTRRLPPSARGMQTTS